MTRFARRGLSRLVGWATDRRVPRFLRGTVYGGFARYAGADLSEVRLAIDDFPSLGAFFIRELKAGSRPIDPHPDALVSPVDGTIQTVCAIEQGTVLQAKGRSYPVAELCGGLEQGLELEGGSAWTVYLSPRDYHRIHAPIAARLDAARWIDGERFSVAPKVLDRRRVLDVNERCVLRLESARGTFLLVLVGALNVGRIRVVGVQPSYAPQPVRPGSRFERGAELARFEMGSTIVLIAPRGVASPTASLASGQGVRLGARIGNLLGRA
ncbi:MAG: archaetidylserine decarboxylase [Planctomycetota bacterium]|nr:archaetidylserine decarboxylase [Planctomycetota bacterium]